ncbi:hypothetical protein B0H11DRAFT_1923539 [Mycena galericulata]|nr:hypothetical protein B0H11DRAFT_1923539 [Mycena galericulata]
MYRLVADYLDYLKDNGPDEEVFSDVDMSDAQDSDSSPTDISIGGYASTHVGSEPESAPALVTDPFSVISTEVGLQILQELCLADRLSLALVSRACAALAAEALQSAATEHLSRFHLRFGEMRLMQAATGAVFAGSVLTAMAHSGAPFAPGDLDIVTGHGLSFEVSRFLEFMGYDVTDVSTQYKYALGIGKVMTLKHAHLGLTINILESLTRNPFDAIGHFHFTCVFAAWTSHGLWYGYPQLLTSGRTITTPRHLTVGDSLDRQQRVWHILHKYMARGFVYSLNEFEAAHTCGIHCNCPATLRTTDDHGCIYTKFPTWEYTLDAAVHGVTCWSLGGSGCAQGVLARPTAQAQPATSAIA